jgi:type VI secretion system secreted protein Hcp
LTLFRAQRIFAICGWPKTRLPIMNHVKLGEIEMQIRNIKLVVATSAVALALLGAGSVSAAIDTFLKIDGIDGESSQDRHKGESDILGWSFSMAGGSAGKKGCIQGIEVMKPLDSASPKIIANAATGAIMPHAVLKVRKPGGQVGEFLVITMSNVLISSYRVTSSDGSSNLAENVVLSFNAMDGAYRKQNGDGSLGAVIPWNVGPSGSKCD